MWNILLVEDEPFVRRTIRNTIPWEEHDFTIVAEAAHGLEALEQMEALSPDIVISDVLMPYMDGIELLREARKRGNEAAFIMLTCAGEFEYARMALEYGASSYILKLSMDDDKLLEALNKVKNRLQRRSEEVARLKSDSLEERLPYLWKQACGKELSKAEASKLAELSPHEMGTRLMLLTWLERENGVSCEEARELLTDESQDAYRLMTFRGMGVTTWFVWHGDAAVTSALTKKLNGNPHKLTGVCRTVYLKNKDAEDVAREWACQLRELDRFFYNGRIPAISHEYEIDQQDEYPAVPWELEQEIMRSFAKAAVSDCAEKLTELWAFMENHRLPMIQVKETAERLDRLFARISRKPVLPEAEGLPYHSRHQALLETLMDRMFRYSKGRSRQALEETDHKEINRVIRYVFEHFDEDISLQAMAQKVNMDENYLSGLFKKKTGQTFIGYLQQVRVQEAKGYLEETDLTMAEIGERCGFANPSYFFRIFKRWTGLRPSEYRLTTRKEEAGR
ncbi:two-component system response regulator YesN [Fontibacillus phaseoli]|uniref:Two-component system response regulator YesN n=1 Tax=Fontibacillus phaseoli TaxID=1416533 RepID=A0A369BJA1_9BACL|nr:helix-turn-helix domain-containing protein [Fontibacillus phaseoli]RCX21680.1 two-component system response regulator YesN [Fontibacillus phaseoli]